MWPSTPCGSDQLIIDLQEERKQMKKDIERRRMEAAERKKHMSNMEGEEFNSLSPKTSTHKVTVSYCPLQAHVCSRL